MLKRLTFNKLNDFNRLIEIITSLSVKLFQT